MILRRLGNKKRIAAEIYRHFPIHELYIEPFFGAGGMFFQKPKAKYNIVNDYDSDVYNLFQVVSNQKSDLEQEVFKMPIHDDLWNHWRANKEKDPIKRAVRFLFLSNFGYMGKANTLCFNGGNTKKILYENIDRTNKFLFDVEFMNNDFRTMFSRISLRGNDVNKGFVCADPPYLDTANNYESGFIEQDSIDLFTTLVNCNLKFAMSEFDHPFILEQARYHNLHVEVIGERNNLKNRRVEVLVMNYLPQLTLF
jgi:DNA adenine methylase